MIVHNCASIGSLVHRAQGYKKLKDDTLMASRFYIPDSSSKNRSYYLVCECCRAYQRHDNRNVSLEAGTMVISVNTTRRPTKDLEVKTVDVYKKVNNSEEIIYRCSPEKLIPISEKLFNLLAAIKSPAERVKIYRDTNRCKELCSIDTDSVVRVRDSHLGLVLSKKPIRGDGVGVRFEVLIQDNLRSDGPSKYKSGDQVTVSADFLRVIDYPQQTSSNTRLNIQYSTNCFDDADFSSSYDNNRFNPGDKVMWLSEVDPMQATICYRSRIGECVRLHLNKECPMVNCDRTDTVPVLTKELMHEKEFLKKLDEANERERKKLMLSNQNSDFSNNGGVTDLLGLGEEYEENLLNLNLNSPSKYHAECLEDDLLRKLESDQSTETSNNVDDLGVGSVVEVLINDEPHYGVIKWIGSLKYQNTISKPLVAGIELEEGHYNAGSGTLQGHKYFDCAPHRGIFNLLNQCKKDSRFSDSSHLIANDIRALNNSARVTIPGITEPINHIDVDRMFEKYHGIQGHNNSCYLDATLFSMFTFTSVFDSLLLRPANATDCDCYEEVQRVLREEIVNPLRKNLFVHADSVMNLRTLLDNSTSVTGLTCEEKDPEEFLTSLVAQVLKAEPFLKLSSGHEAYYYQLFVEKDEQLVLPNVQQLFEQSLMSSDIKLKEVPSCLIIQMPRFGKSYKMYPRILPSQLLDVTNVIENSPRECSVCGGLAKYECKDCFKHHHNELQLFSFCDACVKMTHTHENRRNHKTSPLQVPRECASFRDPGAMPRQYMELFAVLCIETSHYVAFVKCGSGPDTPWCFFDSMADRKGELNGFNIPEMVFCPDLPLWLSDNGAQAFSEIKDDKNLPTYAKRLLCDAYMCMYQSSDVMMYR